MREITAYIGLGANLGEPLGQVGRAVALLKKIPACRFITASAAYQTAPLDCATPQPDYINAAVALQTTLNAPMLMRRLLAVEMRLGRRRGGAKNAPRTMDLDLLAFGDQVIRSAGLQVPHPRLWRRAFALAPLVEIAGAEFVIPGFGKAGILLAAARKNQRIRRLGTPAPARSGPAFAKPAFAGRRG